MFWQSQKTPMAAQQMHKLRLWHTVRATFVSILPFLHNGYLITAVLHSTFVIIAVFLIRYILRGGYSYTYVYNVIK